MRLPIDFRASARFASLTRSLKRREQPKRLQRRSGAGRRKCRILLVGSPGAFVSHGLAALLWKAKRLGKGSFGTVHKASAGVPAALWARLDCEEEPLWIAEAKSTGAIRAVKYIALERMKARPSQSRQRFTIRSSTAQCPGED